MTNRHGQLVALIVDDPVEVWQAAGFHGDDVVKLGNTTIVPTGVLGESDDGHRRGITGACIAGLGELDGLALGTWNADAEASGDNGHANGAVAIDHVVVMSPDCDRTTAAFEAQGLEARRVRRIELPDGDRRQTFFWMGDVICELVGPDVPQGESAASWWGLAITVADIDATAALLGEAVTPVKDAVQPGRRVCTLRRDAGLSVPVLFISEHPGAEAESGE